MPFSLCLQYQLLGAFPYPRSWYRIKTEFMSAPKLPSNLWTYSLLEGQASWPVQIVAYTGDPSIGERLQEIGLSEGVDLTYVGRAPFKGPLLFRVGPAVVALREEEVQCLLIRPT